MGGKAFLVRLLVILAVIRQHPIDCDMTATVSRTLDTKDCPGTCVCNPEREWTRLTCSIGGRSGEEINLDIEAKLANLTSDITVLSISREPMMESVPMIICRMQMLEVLDLNSNSITDLPKGCFTELKRLTKLHLKDNKISTLKRGTFEGLQQLEELTLYGNGLVSIDPEIFANRSDLISLNNLNLSRNKITSVDAWIFIRAQAHPGCTVHLGWNLINNFTNSVGWNFTCEMTPLNFLLRLNNNPIQRISNIFKPYHIGKLIDVLCLMKKTFDLDLGCAEVICDCRDFEYFRFTRWAFTRELDSIRCSGPTDFQGQRMMNVPIDQFVCDIVDQCPSGCKCTKQPSTLSIIVDCKNARLYEMPLHLPQIKQDSTYRYTLILAENQIYRLDYREYMKQTKSIDINHAGVTDIAEEVWRSFQYVSHVNLNGNKLKRIPKVVTSWNFSNTVLDIRDNPMSCDCDSQWLKSWLKSVSGILLNPNGINCYEPSWLNGKTILTLNEEEFCLGRPYTIREILEITIPSIGGVILLNWIGVYLSKRYRIQIYKYVKLHPFDRDECIGEDIDYDAFLTCSSEDGVLGYSILRFLEENGCRVCYHKKDFIPGESISDNIINAITKSKRTICVLTRELHPQRVLYGRIQSLSSSSSSEKERAIDCAPWLTRT